MRSLVHQRLGQPRLTMPMVGWPSAARGRNRRGADQKKGATGRVLGLAGHIIGADVLLNDKRKRRRIHRNVILHAPRYANLAGMKTLRQIARIPTQVVGLTPVSCRLRRDTTRPGRSPRQRRADHLSHRSRTTRRQRDRDGPVSQQTGCQRPPGRDQGLLRLGLHDPDHHAERPP